MNKISVGAVLSRLMKETNLSASELAKGLGKSRQNVYLDLKRTSMKDEQIQQYAEVFGIGKDEIYDRINGAEPENYLQEMLGRLEEQFKLMTEQSKTVAEEFKNQIAVKDRQIEKLLDLLGKHSLGGNDPCGIEMPMYKKEVA